MLISPSNTAPSLTDPATHEPFYARTAHNDKVQGAAMATFACEELGVSQAATVHELCGVLPDDQRTVILLRILADLTVEQVGQVMGRSVASVKALQRRGLRTLRQELEGSPEMVGATANPFASLRR